MSLPIAPVRPLHFLRQLLSQITNERQIEPSYFEVDCVIFLWASSKTTMLPGGEIPADNAKLNLVQIFDEV